MSVVIHERGHTENAPFKGPHQPFPAKVLTLSIIISSSHSAVMMINCLFLHQAEGLGYDPKPKEKKKVGQKNIYIYIKYYIHKDFTQKHSTSLRSELVYFTFKFIPFLLKPLFRRWSIFNSNNKKPETDFGEKKKKKKSHYFRQKQIF